MGEEEMTISVELALQREMEYRRKINGKTLQLLPFDSGDEILPVQVKFPSPNPPEQNLNITPRPCGREQLPPPSNPGCLPSSAPSRNPFSRPNISSGPRIFERKQQLGSSSNIPPPQQLQAFKNLNHPSNYFCKDCQVPCSGYLNYKQHINGKMHKAKLQALKLDRKDGGGASNSTVANEKPYCKLCNVWCSDLNLLRQHLLGQKHKKMQAKLGEIAVEQNRCQLCGIECNSKELLQAHYDGKKHQAELRKLEYAQKGSEEAQNRPKRCKVCDVQCADKDSLQRHLMERKHFLHDVDVKKKTVARIQGETKMDEAWKEDDIMPLELAIQREMGYRQKIAMLSMQSANDSGLQLKPLQPGLTSHLRLDSHVSENQKDLFFCEVCQVSCSSAKTYKQHVKGQKHRTNLHLPFKGNDDAGTTAVNSRKKCGLCGIWCMNESSFNQHLEGQKHKERLQNLESTGNNARSMVKKQRFW